MSYPGGKNQAGTLQRLLGLQPLHRNYFELFGGFAAVAKAKTPATSRTVIADVDAGVIAMHGGEGLKPYGEVRHADALQILTSDPAMLEADTLVYLDPPYLRATRSRKRLYAHEYDTPEQHTRLLTVAKALPCMVMISGYASPLYTTMLQGWRREEWPAMTRGGKRIECCWCNFAPPAVHHNPVYAAVGFRERERIKRRAARWRSRFASMPAAERQVVWASLAEAMVDRPSPATAIAAATA